MPSKWKDPEHKRAYQKEWRRRRAEHIKQYNKEYWQRNLEQNRAAGRDRTMGRRLQRHCGITLAEYNERLKAAAGKCGCCGEMNAKRLVLDHCHKTKKARKFVCDTCNQILGMLETHGDKIVSAKRYLKESNAG